MNSWAPDQNDDGDEFHKNMSQIEGLTSKKEYHKQEHHDAFGRVNAKCQRIYRLARHGFWTETSNVGISKHLLIKHYRFVSVA